MSPGSTATVTPEAGMPTSTIVPERAAMARALGIAALAPTVTKT